MPQDVTEHTCFRPALPNLPLGYKFDTGHPMQLVPFGPFTTILKPINLCKRCYIYAITHFHLAVMNKISAQKTVASQAAQALGGFAQYAGNVNSCMHPMFDELHPPIAREGRRVAIIIAHEARRGTASRKPRLSYVVRYQMSHDPRLSRNVRVSETSLREYPGAPSMLQRYWYGDKPHGINMPFIRSVLTRLTPFANSAIWNKLPIDEALLLHYLHQNEKLEEWTAGTTIQQYMASRRVSS
ncbi:hypothetical protein NCC49_006595 [Naganishia albida]|nr:hypothetical protein NCC49_006595 [Naganishia albida]